MSQRPNILFLMTDHTNSQVTAAGSQCLTPNLDAIVEDGGLRLNRCYTTNAICSPARASLMTAMYPSTHGMWDCTHTQRKEWVDVPADRFKYFSHILSDEGYNNGYFGKWHVEQSGKLEDFGWHDYDHTVSGCHLERDPESRVLVKKEGYNEYCLSGHSTGQEELHHPAFDKGIDFIKRHLDDNSDGNGALAKPFCCFVSTIEPHDAYIAPKKFWDMYDLDEIQLSPTIHDEPDGKPEVVKRLRSVWQGLNDTEWKRVTASYYAMVTFLDSEVGRIISFLKDNGLYDNTIIVFTSDHGDMLGGHGLITKGIGTSYEEVYNIPLIIRAPGAEAQGEDSDTLTSLVDVGPTLLDLCGAPALPESQGKSLRPVLEGNATTSDWQEAYAEFFGQRFVYTQRMVWNGDWKYVFSPGGIDELYNLASDPYERNNLADDPAHRDKLIELCKQMWRKMRDIGDDSLFRTHYATLRTAPIGPGSID